MVSWVAVSLSVYNFCPTGFNNINNIKIYTLIGITKHFYTDKEKLKPKLTFFQSCI